MVAPWHTGNQRGAGRVIAVYAVVETGGKQLRVREGDVVRVERLDVAQGAEVCFDRVLCLAGDGRLIPGNPTVAGATVHGTVQRQMRGKKITVFKYKSKVNYRRKTGHRQSLTVIKITGIHTGAEGAAVSAVEPEGLAPLGLASAGAEGAGAAPAPETTPA